MQSIFELIDHIAVENSIKNTLFYGYIYITILPDSRYYIGQKKTKDSIIITKYFGSSQHLNNWFLKHVGYKSNSCPPEAAYKAGVKQTILDFAKDQAELNLLECKYIAQFREIDFEHCLNIHPGGEQSHFTKNSKGYFTEAARKAGLEERRKRRAAGLYTCTEETRRKMSEGVKKALQNKPIWNKGKTKENDIRVRQMAERQKQRPINKSEH